MAAKAAKAKVPADPNMAFAYFVSRCAEGLGKELIAEGKTPTQAKNQIINHFLAFAAGEACRIARAEGRTPDRGKWHIAIDRAFDKALARTDPNNPQRGPSKDMDPASPDAGGGPIHSS